MGYNSSYEIYVKNIDDNDDIITSADRRLDFKEVFERVFKDEFYTGFVYTMGKGAQAYYGTEDTKWYTSDEDFAKVSAHMPGHLITAIGKGEDGEIWADHFFEGKIQPGHAYIAYDAFDPKKLKDVPPRK